MAQWEVCRVGSYLFANDSRNKTQYDRLVGIDYYTPAGVTTKFPAIDSMGQALAILSAAGWELVSVQHRIYIGGVAAGGSLGGRLSQTHPSGDKNWRFDECEVVPYFKRPMQAGRKIDDAL